MKKFLITGASSGLGLYLSRYFNKLNYDLVTIGRSSNKVKLLKDSLNEKNKKNCFKYDLLNTKELNLFKKKIKKMKFDSIIHCMGGGLGMHDPLINQKNLIKLFNLNVSIAVEINNEVISKNLRNKKLRIIHIGSVASIETGASVGYSLVKASLLSYSKTLARYFVKDNIYVHCILPGAFEYDSNSFERLKKKNKKVYKKYIKSKLPLQKISKPEDFIGIFELLTSDNGDILSGSSIVTDFTESNSFRI